MGSPLLPREYGPVTTDPLGKGPFSVSGRRYTRPVANLQVDQNAGSQLGLVDVGSYISGYVDGEGCFTVSVAPRPTLAVGWEVRPSLSVSQNADRSQVLLLMQQYFGCGTIRPDRSDRTLKWEVRRLPLLLDPIIPHFRKYPLLSAKQGDFESFAAVCELMARGDHLMVGGLREIVARIRDMNPGGRRAYLPAAILQAIDEMKA